MKFCALASGSSGNCIYVGHQNTAVLVDAGISGKKIEEGLTNVGIQPADINAILITHDHTDHTQGAAVFATRYGIPIYGTAGTLEYIAKNACKRLAGDRLNVIRADEDFEIGDIRVSPFKTSHDAIDPVGYCLSAGGRKLGMATDLGVYTDYTIEKLADSDALYLEANHDVNMLMLGRYPYSLKQRVHSEKGHLSNDDCGELVSKLRTPKLHTVVLAHVSKENNFEELAYETVRLALERDERYDSIPKLIVARRYEPTGIIQV